MGLRLFLKQTFCRHVWIKVFPLNIIEQKLPFIGGEWYECPKCDRSKGKITVNVAKYLEYNDPIEPFGDYPWIGDAYNGITREHTGSETT